MAANVNPGVSIVVSGPSGVGKDTVKKLVAKKLNLSTLATCTTRLPRVGEVDGVDYHFLTRKSFLEAWGNGELLDFTEFAGNYYGLPLVNLEDQLLAGKDVILDLVPQAAKSLKKLDPRTILVFIGPPSESTIVERLKGRGMCDSEIRERLRDEPATFATASSFDFIVINYDDEAEMTAERITSFIAAKKGDFDSVLSQQSKYPKLALCIQNYLQHKTKESLMKRTQS